MRKKIIVIETWDSETLGKKPSNLGTETSGGKTMSYDEPSKWKSPNLKKNKKREKKSLNKVTKEKISQPRKE